MSSHLKGKQEAIAAQERKDKFRREQLDDVREILKTPEGKRFFVRMAFSVTKSSHKFSNLSILL